MALIKTPGGEFYVESSEFTIDYDENIVRLAGNGEGEAGTYLPLAGGNMEAGATIQGEDELTLSVPDVNESASVGVTPEGVTIVHNTNSDADASVRVIENSVEIKGADITVTVNNTGVNFGGGSITNVSTIGGSAEMIAFENEMNMNNHKITGIAEPTEDSDVASKGYVDGKKGVAVADATGETDIVTQFNALLTSLRNAGLIVQ